MDPNATLTAIRWALLDGKIVEAQMLAEDLGEWLGKGGFAPNWRLHPVATRWLQKLWGVDSLAQPN